MIYQSLFTASCCLDIMFSKHSTQKNGKYPCITCFSQTMVKEACSSTASHIHCTGKMLNGVSFYLLFWGFNVEGMYYFCLINTGCNLLVYAKFCQKINIQDQVRSCFWSISKLQNNCFYFILFLRMLFLEENLTRLIKY